MNGIHSTWYLWKGLLSYKCPTAWAKNTIWDQKMSMKKCSVIGLVQSNVELFVCRMSSNKAFCSFALDSAHEKFDVWTRPYIFKWWCDELLSFELNKMAADKDGFSSYAAVLVTEDLAETETEERRWQVSISRIELRIGREFSYTFFMSFLYFLIYQFISHNSYIYFSIIGCIL